MDSGTLRAYRFDGYRVDVVRRQLFGPDGTALVLPSRAFDVLVHLIANRDHVVSKDELMTAVWPRAVVEENNINQAISAVRRALADPRDAPRFITTIAGRGYRFVADIVEDGQDSAPAAAAPTVQVTEAAANGRAPMPEPLESTGATAGSGVISRRGILAGLASAIAAGAAWFYWSRRPLPADPQSPTIAVLPFQPLLESVSNESLELGMADALINRLSALPGVIVTPWSSVRRYRDRTQDPLAAGRELHVAAVLESNIQIQPERVRLTARLLDVESGAAIWSGRFDEKIGDFFVVQDALARQIVEALEVPLTRTSLARLNRRPTSDLEAWQLYLKGRFHWATRTESGFRQAITYYEAALAADPGLALAAAGLADTWTVLALFCIDPPMASLDRARRAAERAVALDPESAEAQAALGHVMVQKDRDWEGAVIRFREALELNPAYTQAVFWLGNTLCMRGDTESALAHARKAQAMEPASVVFAANVGLIQYYARDFDAARVTLAELIATVPTYQLARRFLVRVLMAQGNFPPALELLRGREVEYAPGCMSDVGRLYALDGQVEVAQREITRLERLGEKGFGVGYDLALIHTALGDHDAALQALERCVTDRSQMVGFLNSEPQFDAIRDDPRFRAVSRSLALG
jgi:DNA-binding winged helix-turn-helix (wHTH) protein/TolB-like protein/Flp pilus assembly protein TadD